ncbi:MAG TPA: toll/interleukin-1 receptor domain-containing protein [Propylenella sp.]|nr:toll/interleukin-1 receptor domain-containing protein [Propylenella sp.]
MSYVGRKIGILLKRLLLDMQARGDRTGESTIRECRYLVIEGTNYDNLDGGIDGHDVVLFLSEEALAQIPIKNQSERRNELRTALSSLIPGAEREFVNDVRLEMADENDPEFQQATPYGNRPAINPDAVSFWKPGQIRLFISHRDRHKVGANTLAEALSAFGISSFVAHDTIEPMSEWQHEVLKGLATMDIMLLYLTDDFAESLWCHQEIGYALGRGIPIISLKLGRSDPPGFEGVRQGQPGNIDNPAASAAAVYKLLAEKLGARERLQDGLVAAFIEAADFDQARHRFDRMSRHIEELSERQLEAITTGYRANDQLYRAIYLNNKYNRLTIFLKRTTGREFLIEGNEISEKKVAPFDLYEDVPF